MDDLISRQAAIDALWKVHQNRSLDSDRWVITDCLQEIDGLPPAQPEPRKGKWIRPIGAQRSSYRYQCSECGEIAYQVNGNCGRKVKMENAPCSYRFCPNCGARMEE